MPLTYAVSTAATTTPISVADCKEHSHIDGNEDNAVLERMIEAATELVQTETRRQLIHATFDWYLDEFPSGDTLRPPHSPLSSVSAITYTDSDGVEQTWASSGYDVDTASEPGRIVLAYGESWPDNRTGTNSIKVTHVAGYGAASTDVPSRIRSLLLLIVADLYENREASQLTTFAFKPNPTTRALLDSFRVVELV